MNNYFFEIVLFGTNYFSIETYNNVCSIVTITLLLSFKLFINVRK